MGSDGLVVIIAGRQRLVIQQMAKECVLIALGIHVEHGPSYRKALHGNISNLKHTDEIFNLSHQGIIPGAAWAGLPARRSVHFEGDDGCYARGMTVPASCR